MRKLGRIAWGAAAVGALMLAAPALMHLPGRRPAVPEAQAQSGPGAATPDAFRRVWAIPVNGFRGAGISPDGSFVGVLSDYSPGRTGAKLSLWRWPDRPLRPLWTRPQPDASMVDVGAGGRVVLSSAWMNPMQRTVALRKGSDGSEMTHATVDGAVWNMQMSDDGRYAGLTTGSHSLYLITLGDGSYVTPQFRRFQLDGIGNSVDITDRNTYFTAGTWDAGGVSCFTVQGGSTPVWQYPNPKTSEDTRDTAAHRLFEAQLTQDGRYVLGLSYANSRQSDGTLYLWRTDGDGTPLWQHSLGINTFFPKALISQDGSVVAVTFQRLVVHQRQVIPERCLTLLTQDERVLWQQGNLLFSPTLAAISRDGRRVTVSDGVRTLYDLNANGRITRIYSIKGTATIQKIVATSDGRFLLVYMSDGWLNLFQIG